MKILILIRSLETGGAERQAALLAGALRAAGETVAVAVFYGGGALERDLDPSGVPLIDLGKRSRWDVLGFLWRLLRLLRAERPDVLYTWLPVPNLCAALLRPLLPRTRLVWAVRSAFIDLDRYDWLSRLTARLEIALASRADAIIANSRAGRDYAVRQGFPATRLRVVANGIDTERFRPDPAARRRIRTEWGCAAGDLVIGLIGRLDPMKGHATFLRAARDFAAACPAARFVCVGDGPAGYRAGLTALAAELGLADRVLWAGNRTDMPAVCNALDIAVSASSGEGLPNAVAEAMASGIPCVVTAVGDSADVVGATGVVVPAEDPVALAEGLERMRQRLAGEGPALARAARARIIDHFSVAALTRNTLAEFRRVP